MFYMKICIKLHHFSLFFLLIFLISSKLEEDVIAIKYPSLNWQKSLLHPNWILNHIPSGHSPHLPGSTSLLQSLGKYIHTRCKCDHMHVSVSLRNTNCTRHKKLHDSVYRTFKYLSLHEGFFLFLVRFEKHREWDTI